MPGSRLGVGLVELPVVSRVDFKESSTVGLKAMMMEFCLLPAFFLVDKRLEFPFVVRPCCGKKEEKKPLFGPLQSALSQHHILRRGRTVRLCSGEC